MRFSSFVQTMWTDAGTISQSLWYGSFPYPFSSSCILRRHWWMWYDLVMGKQLNGLYWFTSPSINTQIVDINIVRRYHRLQIIYSQYEQEILHIRMYHQLILLYIFRWCSNLYCGAGELCGSSLQHYSPYLHRSGTFGSFLQEWLNGPYLHASKDRTKCSYKF